MKKEDQKYPPLTEQGLSCFVEATGWMELGAYSEVLESLKTLPQ